MSNWWDEQQKTAGSLASLQPTTQPPSAPAFDGAANNPYATQLAQGLQAYRNRPSRFSTEPASLPAPAQPPEADKPVFDLGNSLSALYEGATEQFIPGVKSALAQAYTGLERPDRNPEWATRFMEEGRQAQQQADQRTAELQRQGQSDSTSEAIRSAIPSLGFSLGSMAAAIPAGLAGAAATQAAIPIPGSGFVGGALAAGAASGVAAYRMAESQFLNDTFSQMEQESQKQRGRGMTEQEKETAYQALRPIAENTGLWEAGPEAVGNAALLGLGRVALGLMPKAAMRNLAASALGRAGVRTGAAAGALATEVGTEGVTQFAQGNDQQKGQAAIDALLSGKDMKTAMAAVDPQYQGFQGLVQSTKDVAPATIATVLLMGGMVKPGHMAYSAMRDRHEGNARVEDATQATADLRANLEFARENDITAALTGFDQIEASGKLPKAAAKRLDAARQQLIEELSLRAAPDALNEPLDTRRGQAGYLGFADRANELNDDQVLEASQRPLPQDAPTELQDARARYGQEAKRRQDLNLAAAHFDQNPEAVDGVAKVLADIGDGKPLNKGGHGSVDYNLSSLSDDMLARYRMAGTVLLRDHAEALGNRAKKLNQTLALLSEETERRASGQRRDPQAIREADIAQRIAKGAKNAKKLLTGLSPDAMERMASGLESRARLEPGLANTAREIRALANKERARLFNPQGAKQPGIQSALRGWNQNQPAPQAQPLDQQIAADRARLSEIAQQQVERQRQEKLADRTQAIQQQEADRRARLNAEIATRNDQGELARLLGPETQAPTPRQEAPAPQSLSDLLNRPSQSSAVPTARAGGRGSLSDLFPQQRNWWDTEPTTSSASNVRGGQTGREALPTTAAPTQPETRQNERNRPVGPSQPVPVATQAQAKPPVELPTGPEGAAGTRPEGAGAETGGKAGAVAGADRKTVSFDVLNGAGVVDNRVKDARIVDLGISHLTGNELFAVHPSLDKGGGYSVSHVGTGVRIGNPSMTEEGAIAHAKTLIESAGKEKFEKSIKKLRKINDVSKIVEKPPTDAETKAGKRHWEMTREEWLDASRFYRSGKEKMLETPSGERVILKRERTASNFMETSSEFLEKVRRQQIDAALASGKPVPAEVLADYPDLQPSNKPAAQQPNQEPRDEKVQAKAKATVEKEQAAQDDVAGAETTRPPLSREQLDAALKYSPIKDSREYAKDVANSYKHLIVGKVSINETVTSGDLADMIAATYDLSNLRIHVDFSALKQHPNLVFTNPLSELPEQRKARLKRKPAARDADPKTAWNDATKAERAAIMEKAGFGAAKPEGYGKSNKIFTEDAAAKARELLKRKLGQLSSGIDPEIIQAGITLAGYHIEAGARTFAAYTKAMIADLGGVVRPHLRSWYEGIRYYPGFDAKGMTWPEYLNQSEKYDVWPGDAWSVKGENKTVEDVGNSYINWADGTQTPLSNWYDSKKSGDVTLVSRIGEKPDEQSAADRTERPGMGAEDQGGSETDQGGRKPATTIRTRTSSNDGVVEGEPPADVAPTARKDAGVPAGDRATGSISKGNRPAAGGGNAASGRAGASDGGMAAGRTGGRPGGTRSDGGVTDDAPIISYPNYEITDPKALIGGTPKRRFEKNRKAIETYLELKESGLQPTKEQLDAMAAYIGWGSFGQELFNGSWEYKRPKQGWETEDNWLREHLGKDAWESAQASILNAHYTDPPTVSAIWRIAQKLGFRGGRVLEPSMGVGNFFGLMPRDLMANSQLTGIELDETTAGIAKLLYPDATVRQMGYQDSKTADDFYDLVIGNWPFAKQGPADRRYNRLSPSLHDYFFLKALDQVRPGGLVIGITSRFSMDKKAQGIRREMARKAELVTAIRLPTGAFDEYAGTSVVTDIIVLKKRAEPVVSPTDAWIETATASIRGDKVEYNRFYFDNPDNIFGNVDFGSGTTTGRPGLIVTRQPGFESALERVADKVQEGVYEPRTNKDATRYLTEETKDRQQSVTVGKDGNLYQVQGDRLARLEDVAPWAVKDKKQTAAREAQIRSLVGLRRDVNALFAAERDSTVGDSTVESLRATLKKSYQAFVAEHGPINESFGAKQLRKIDDPYYAELAALETKEGERWVPVAAMDRPTTRGKPKQTNLSVSDALVIARNERMDFDVGRVAELANVSREEAIKQLLESGAAFEAPDGSYVVSDQYLSGNVRRKLREAKAAMEEGKPGMERNIAELEKVVPKDIPYYNIEARMGASWIPVDVYGDFVRELLGVSGRSDPVPIRKVGGSWKVDYTPIFNRSEAERWTAYLPFRKALSAALNVRAVTIRTKDPDGNLVVNDEETKKANAKIAEIREEFVNWIWKSPERQVDLERVYNEVMNAMASPSFDGSFLSFDGMALQRGTSQFALRQHQVDAIYRGLVNRRGMYAHEVGTGKTYTIAGVAVESRRYGIARKPLIFAHNANSRAVSNGIKEMYPNAKVLYIDNLSPDTIDVRLRQIKMDDWDAVVVPHSLIDRFALSRESLMDLAKEDIDSLEEEAYDAASEDGIPEHVVGAALAGDEDAMKKIRSQTAKDLVRARNQIIANIEKQAMRASKEGAVTFEELGVDQLIVDEAHLFKKPPIATRMVMRGLNKTASGRSIALNFLASYIKRTNNGAGVHLFTGTPITNTLTETFHVMRYVMDDEMKRDGLSEWDSWFNSFASETNDVEITSSGEYEPVTRLATFINVADLRRMMGNYMDIVFADDMPEFVPRKTDSGKTMADKLTAAERDDLENGRSESAVGRPYKKIVVDSADMTPEQQNIMALLVERAKTFRNATRKERKEIMLSGLPESPIIVETDASNAALDQRLFKDKGSQVYESGSPNSKAARAVKNTLKHYRESRLSTQVIFMDRGFGGQRGNFDLAKAIVDDLVSGGIPRKEIAVVTGSTSNDRRAEIADAMNRVEIRVVIGNTQTLGVGVNMQENLRAMHHLDAPWTPADLEQRNGRGHRQGNKWNTVMEYRYLTERLDGRRWQVLAVKDRFIKSFLKADENVRVIEGDAVDDSEGGDIVSTLSEAAGDPRILIVKKLSADVEKLQARERMHGQAVVEAKRQEKIKKDLAEEGERNADLYEIEAETYETSRKERGFYAKIGDKEFSDREAANAALNEFVKNEVVPSTEPKPFGEINGLALAYSWTGRGGSYPYFYIGNEAPRSTNTVSFNAFQQIASGFGRVAEDNRQKADYHRSSIANLSKQAEETFGRAEELKRKKDHLARVQLDMQLNPVPPPFWLRNGAPVGSIAHADGKPYAVVGHRWTNDGYTVELQSEDGKTQKSVSYDEVTDNQGIALYEPHPFAPPEITAQTRQSRPSSTTDQPDLSALSAIDLSNNKGVMEFRAFHKEMGTDALLDNLANRVVSGNIKIGQLHTIMQPLDYNEGMVAAALHKAGATPEQMERFGYEPPTYARQSRPSSTTAKPATVTTARAQLVTALGERNVTALERAGALVLHATDPTRTGAAGYVDGKGIIHLIPGNMDQDALSVAVHEAMHLARDDRFAEGDRAKVRLAHAALKLGGLKNFVGNPGFSELVQQVYRMAAEGNPVAVEALNKAKLEARADPRVDVAEEAVAYLAQYADQKYPLVRRVLAAIRAALYRMGIKVNLTPADVRALALSALKARAKARATRIANIERLETAFAKKHGWEALGDRRTDVLRRLPGNATLDDFERMAERALRSSQPADEAEQERLWQEFQAVRAKFQARQPTETVFRRWFGKGTEGVTARDGKPIILYHGTNNPEFNRWDESLAGQASRHPTAGLGFFMTADKGSAARYGSRLLELNAKIDKPYYLTDADLTAIESIQDAARMRRKLMARGYDGAVVSAPGAAPYVIAFESKQVKHTTNENPTDSEDFRYSRPGRAPRLDSPRVAAKVLGDIGELRDALKPAEKAKAKIDPRNWTQMLSDLKTDKKPAWLALLTQDMLLQLANKHLPAADVRQFDDASERMDAYEAKIIQGEAFPMAERWQNLMTRDRQQADAMSRLIYMSTWLGVDPRKAAPKNKGAEWTRAKAAYDGLTNPEARKLYGEVLAFYESQTKRLFDELAARIDRHSLPEPDKLAAKDMLRQEFERMKQEGPYAPLMRFGDLTVWAEPRKRGEKPVFATFESVTEQRAFADWLKSEGYEPRIGVKMEEIEKRNLPQGDFVGKMAGIIDKTAKGPEAQLLKDAMYQLFLRSMPEQAIRKHFIHRKFVPGYSSDALRTFATFARRSSKQTARLAHADKMGDALDRMAKSVRDGTVDDPVAAGHLVNELDKSYQWAMNPTTATWASRLTHLGFMWHLGASPAHLLLNLTQQAQVTAPWLAGELAGKKGFGAVAGALLKANKDFIASNPFVDPAKRGASANQARTRLEAEWGGDMGRALKALEKAGKTDKTQTYSIAGLSEEDNFLWTRPLTRKLTQGAAWFFHVAEVINREASAIAAYRLGRQSGMSHEAAYDLARRAINETHFDYSPSNRARFMRGNVAKVVTLFKQYSLNVTWQLGRNAYLAARGASPKEKTVARTKLLGMLGVTFAMAGAVGLPFYGEVMWLLTKLLNADRDDDEPEWDADTTVRSLLDNALSPTGEQVVRRGLVNAFLGVDLSSRVKLDDLWWRGSDSDLQGKQAAYHAMEQLLGPVAGLGVRGFASANDAIDAILSGTSARGATWRAMEGAMPKAIKDISKAFRFQSEGATTFDGARVLEPGELGSAESVGQLLGFAPAKLMERYAENRAMMNLQRRIQRQRDALLDSYAMAYRQNDEEVMDALFEDMAAFNKRYPGKKITGATLNQSLRARERRREEIERFGGVALDKRLAGMLLDSVR